MAAQVHVRVMQQQHKRGHRPRNSRSNADLHVSATSLRQQPDSSSPVQASKLAALSPTITSMHTTTVATPAPNTQSASSGVVCNTDKSHVNGSPTRSQLVLCWYHANASGRGHSDKCTRGDAPLKLALQGTKKAHSHTQQTTVLTRSHQTQHTLAHISCTAQTLLPWSPLRVMPACASCWAYPSKAQVRMVQ